MTTGTTKFQIGQELSTRSLCDYDCVFRFKVVKRSEKFVTLSYYNELKRVGIKVRDGVEYCHPLGSYSMAPSVNAKEGN